MRPPGRLAKARLVQGIEFDKNSGFTGVGLIGSRSFWVVGSHFGKSRLRVQEV